MTMTGAKSVIARVAQTFVTMVQTAPLTYDMDNQQSTNGSIECEMGQNLGG